MTDNNKLQHIKEMLTPDQLKCILDLEENWKQFGYSKTQADLICATDNVCFEGRFDPLVECSYHKEPNQGYDYHHRLTPLGLELQNYVKGMVLSYE